MNFTENNRVIELAAKIFLFLSFVVILVVGKYIFIPLAFALLLSFLLYPVSRSLEKIKFPKSVAIIFSILLAIIVLGGVIYFFLDQIYSFREDLPLLKSQALNKGMRVLDWIENRTLITRERQIFWMKDKITKLIDSAPDLLMGIFSTTGTFFAMLALIPLYIFFLTYFKEKYKYFIVLVSKEKHEKVIDIIRKVAVVSQKYLKGVFIDVLILSVLGSIGYLLLGIKHAILFGVLAALLNIIPYVGVLFGSLLPVMMAIITKDEIGYAFGAAGVAVVVQFIDNNFISPYVIGSSVSINPLTAMLALLTGALIWGIAGMIISIPLIGMVKVVFDNIESLKPYGYLMGEEKKYQQKRFFKKTG